MTTPMGRAGSPNSVHPKIPKRISIMPAAEIKDMKLCIASLSRGSLLYKAIAYNALGRFLRLPNEMAHLLVSARRL